MNDTETPFCITEVDGSRNWYVVRAGHRVRHRLDGPAIEKIGRQKTHREWYRDGELHREDGPAMETLTKVKARREWWIGGKRHRLDGPALEYKNNNQRNLIHEYWFRDGELHREDGPAVTKYGKFSSRLCVTFSDYEKWYRDGELHREDGPAVDYRGVRGEWHWRGNWIPSAVVRTVWFQRFRKEYCELLEEFGCETLDRIQDFVCTRLQKKLIRHFFENPDNIALFRVTQT